MASLQAPVDGASRCNAGPEEEGTWETPEPATTEPATMLLAQISRKAGQRMGLGVNWTSSVNHLVVTKLEPCLARRVNNAKQPEERLAVGDLIVDVNGEQGNDKMLALLTNSTIMDLDITFMKCCGEAPCDNPELRAELQSVLPEYRIVWPSVTSVLMERVESCGLLKQSVQHSFHAKLLPSGMLQMADSLPKRRGARHERELARVSTLAALVGDREVLRRQKQKREKAELLVDEPPALSPSVGKPPMWSPSVGDLVEGRYLNGRFYKAIVEEEHGDGKYTLKWVDGDTVDCVKTIQDLRELKVDAREQLQQQQQVPASSVTTSLEGSLDKTEELEEFPDVTPTPSDMQETMLDGRLVAQIPKRHVEETSPVDTVWQSGPIPDISSAANFGDAHPFVGAVSRGADVPTQSPGRGSPNMRALAEAHKKGDLSQGEFQQRAAAVFGWDLQMV